MNYKEIKINKDYKIKPILNGDDLFKTLKFLKKVLIGQRNIKKFYKKLIDKKYPQDLYGYFLEKNDSISGAIIFVNQTFQEKKNNIINLSSWYMKKEVRGIMSLIFLRKILNKRRENIITSLSANKESRLIYKTLGFKSAKSYNYRFSFFRILFYLFSNIKNSKTKLKVNKNKFSTLDKSIFLRDAEFISLNIDKKVLNLFFSKANKEFNLFFIKFRFKGLRILWVSDESLYIKYFKDIFLLLLKRNFCFFITSHCNLNINDEDYKEKNCHLFFSKKNDEPNLITLGSEFTLNI